MGRQGQALLATGRFAAAEPRARWLSGGQKVQNLMGRRHRTPGEVGKSLGPPPVKGCKGVCKQRRLSACHEV